MADPRTLEALSDAISVMATLRQGCPWDREQTHASLAKYAIEEAHEVAEAAETGDLPGLREELGDLLLQVLFHAEIASETGAFSLADVADTLVDKLRRRHPHVFAGVRADTPADVEANWDAIKRDEKLRDGSVSSGVPANLPALMRAQKVARRAGLDTAPADVTPETLGAQLLALARAAQAAGIDAEQALRGATREWEQTLDLPSPR